MSGNAEKIEANIRARISGSTDPAGALLAIAAGCSLMMRTLADVLDELGDDKAAAGVRDSRERFNDAVIGSGSDG